MRGGGGGRGERERERVGLGVKNWPWKIHLFFFAGGRNVQRFCALGSVAEVRDLLSEPLTHQHLLDAVGRRRLETETWDVAVAHVPHFLLIHSNMCRFVFFIVSINSIQISAPQFNAPHSPSPPPPPPPPLILPPPPPPSTTSFMSVDVNLCHSLSGFRSFEQMESVGDYLFVYYILTKIILNV